MTAKEQFKIAYGYQRAWANWTPESGFNEWSRAGKRLPELGGRGAMRTAAVSCLNARTEAVRPHPTRLEEKRAELAFRKFLSW